MICFVSFLFSRCISINKNIRSQQKKTYGLGFFENYIIERRSYGVYISKDENYVPFEQGGG